MRAIARNHLIILQLPGVTVLPPDLAMFDDGDEQSEVDFRRFKRFI